MATNTQPVCEPCTRERADVVRHKDPCETSDDDEYFAIKLGRVQTGLLNTLEDLRACIVTARHQHRVAEAQVLDEIRMNVEQESRAVLLVGDGFSLAARAGTGEDVPAPFSEGAELL